jgi:hypothetical protein
MGRTDAIDQLCGNLLVTSEVPTECWFGQSEDLRWTKHWRNRATPSPLSSGRSTTCGPSGVHRDGDRRREMVALSAGEVAAVWPGRGFKLRPDGSLPPDVSAAEPHRRCERLPLNSASLAYRIAVRLNFIGGQARTAPALPQPRGRDQVDPDALNKYAASAARRRAHGAESFGDPTAELLDTTLQLIRMNGTTHGPFCGTVPFSPHRELAARRPDP